MNSDDKTKDFKNDSTLKCDPVRISDVSISNSSTSETLIDVPLTTSAKYSDENVCQNDNDIIIKEASVCENINTETSEITHSDCVKDPGLLITIPSIQSVVADASKTPNKQFETTRKEEDMKLSIAQTKTGHKLTRAQTMPCSPDASPIRLV